MLSVRIKRNSNTRLSRDGRRKGVLRPWRDRLDALDKAGAAQHKIAYLGARSVFDGNHRSSAASGEEKHRNCHAQPACDRACSQGVTSYKISCREPSAHESRHTAATAGHLQCKRETCSRSAASPRESALPSRAYGLQGQAVLEGIILGTLFTAVGDWPCATVARVICLRPRNVTIMVEIGLAKRHSRERAPERKWQVQKAHDGCEGDAHSS